MNATPPAESRKTHRFAHLILLVAAALQLARIMQVQSSTGEVPFLSANDRSRWCTVAALAIQGNYEIDDILEIRDPSTRRRTWYTIDLVQHRGSDGRQHFYSSKPPLLPTLYAGVYLAVRAATGSTLMNDPFFVARIMLVIVNLIPLLGLWILLGRWIEREDCDDWSTMVLLLFIGFGTFLSTFTNTLNNHLPAALCVGISLWCLARALRQPTPDWRWFAVCGLCTSFAAANELPALAWTAAAGVFLAIVDFKKCLWAYVPALLPVGLAFFVTNFLAHGEVVPAYAHRGLGPAIADLEVPPAERLPHLPPAKLIAQLRSSGIAVSDAATIRTARRPETWELWDPQSEQRFGLRQRETQAAVQVTLYQWGDWYDYPGSYWTSDRKQGVDRGEPNRAVYIFHCLIGHHGIWSLTPFWLVSLWGCFIVWRDRRSWNPLVDRRLLLTAAIVATSAVTIAFYLARPLEDRNYGGVTSGFRWAFWLTVPWIWLAMHGLRHLQGRWPRRCVELLLAISVFSAMFPWNNPWTNPWLMQYWQYLGWI